MSAFTDLLEDINARRLYLVTVKPYAFIRGTFTASATGNKFSGSGMFRGILKGDVLQTKGSTSDNKGTITVVSATDDEIVVSGLTLTNQSSHIRIFEGVVVRYYSTDGLVTEPTDVPANQWYDPRVETALQFTRSMYNGSSIGGQSIPGYGQITLQNLDGGMDAYRSWGWAGRRVTVEMGGEDFTRAEYGVIFDGLTRGIELSDEFFTIEVRDLQALLDQDLWVPTYLGTGATEGPVDLLGQYKPLTIGKVRNIQPIPLGIVNGRFTYQYNDGIVDTYAPGLYENFLRETGTLDPKINFSRASSATVIDSLGIIKQVGNNVPRFDYDPVTLKCRGLLIEEARTNLLLYSDDFNASVGNSGFSWGFGSTLANFFSYTPNAMLAPDGTNRAVRFTSTGVSPLFARAVRSSTAGLHSVSIWVYVPTQSGISQWGIRSDAQDTDISAVYASSVFDRWVNANVSINYTGTRTFLDFDILVNGVTTPANGFIFYVFGAQLEMGAFQTSYIPTTSSTATRAADVAVLQLSSIPFNTASGTLVTKSRLSRVNTTSGVGIAEISNGTSSEQITLFYRGSGAIGASVITSNVAVADLTPTGVLSSGQTVTTALAYSVNDFAACADGGTVSVDTSGSVPSVDRIIIGARTGSNYLSGHIQEISYYPSRLSNTALQTITQTNIMPDVSSAYDQGVSLVYSSSSPVSSTSNDYNLSPAEYAVSVVNGLSIIGGSEPSFLTLDTTNPDEDTYYSVPKIMEYLVKNRLRLDATNSTSSVSIQSGSRSFSIIDTFPTAVTGKILISLRDDPENFWMYGDVTSWSGGTLTVNVSRLAGTGTYDDWVITKIGLLDSEIVSNTFSDLHELNPSIAGIYIPSGNNALQVMDELAQSIGAYYGFNREGKFEVGRLESPTGSANLVLTGEEILELTRDNTRAPVWRIQLAYNKNWSVMAGTDIAGSVRSNIVTNGTFDTATGWVFGTGWSFGANKADAVAGTGSDLYRAINLVNGQTYTLRFELTRSAGSIQPKLTSTNLGSSINTSGVFEVDFTATSTTGNIVFSKDSSFVGSVDNVTIVSKNLKFLSNEYRLVTSADTSIRSVYGPNAISERINTLLDLEIDTQNESDRQLELFGNFRDVFKIEAKTQAFAVDINSLVELTDYRWGLEDGKLFRVLEISEDTSDNRVTLTLWG